MAKHSSDLVFCRKQPGISIGRLCEKCDGRCVICDSHVNPCTLIRICDECNYGVNQGKCIICNGVGVSDAYYCKECTLLENDRDGWVDNDGQIYFLDDGRVIWISEKTGYKHLN